MRIDPSDIALALALADAAGAAIRPFYRVPHGVETKPDRSPVTLADRAAERAMRALIVAERPRDGIVGEEEAERPGSSGRQWVLDPIDGTRSFVAGRPIFGTLIALLADGWPVLGVIDQPVLRERWLGVTGRPTTLNGTAAHTRVCPALDAALLASTAPGLFAAARRPGFATVEARALSTIWGGDCYNYALLASGHIDLVIEDGLKLHDFAALVPVVEGAGGRMCDWAGEPLTADSAGDVLALGDPARAQEAIELLGERKP